MAHEDIAPCICSEPGWCPRFKRDMLGRLYEVCTGRCPEERPCTQQQVLLFRMQLSQQANEGIGIEPQPEIPSLAQRATSASIAYAKWFAAGRPRATPEQMAERQAICNACEYATKDASGTEICGKCGCPFGKVTRFFGTIETPGKLEMATEQCPLDPPKWRALV